LLSYRTKNLSFGLREVKKELLCLLNSATFWLDQAEIKLFDKERQRAGGRWQKGRKNTSYGLLPSLRK